ncbi:hypothetical protein Gogos_005427, partial [Gossypium gossypioides]|nr:hypothetical protein [Gossypium gossypioides]
MIELFAETNVKWIGRNRNKVADNLCNHALNNQCNLPFSTEYPSDIHN